VTVMADADHAGPGPDLYQLLRVSRDVSRDEIAQAWRRRARDEHPDARPADDGAPGRFRALAEAWQVLGDPGRRAAYDRALERGQTASGMPGAVPVPARRAKPGGPAGLFPVPGPPLRAGPVRVEGTPAASAGSLDEDQARLAVLAALALRCLARDRLRQDRLW
jgi:curved DNA-binding protein CbpA